LGLKLSVIINASVNHALTSPLFFLVTPGQANYVLDGSPEEDIQLSAWHIAFADYRKLAEVLAKQPNENVRATLNPIG
jgi:ethanolamine ammonia-lyase large subunit